MTTGWPIMTARLPRFLAAQVERFYRKRLFTHPRVPGRPFWYSLHTLGPGSVNLQSNDYLALTGHPTISEAALQAIGRPCRSAVMSQVVLVTQQEACPQRDVERQLGRFIGHGSGVLFQSGYDANVGLLQAVAQRGLPVYVDQEAHASLYQGVHAAEAVPVRVIHNDLNDLRSKLQAGGPGIIAVDSVYSVSGSCAPLREVTDLAEEFGCLLIVDESHALGTHGAQGRGLVHDLGLTGRVPLVSASLAKAFATRAGFVACADELSEYLRFTAFPSIFSTALLPQEFPPLQATLDVVMGADDRRAMLWQNTRLVRAAVEAAGFDIGNGSEQIIGIRCGPVRSAVLLRDALESRGVFGSLFWYPATEWRQSVLRLSVNAGLGPEDIRRIVLALKAARAEVDDSLPALTRPRLRDAPRAPVTASFA